MKTAFTIAALLTVAASPAQGLRPYLIDSSNRFPMSGALLIDIVEPNPFGLPVGLAAFCSGTLIEDRVFLTAGHCVGPSVPELPPFAKAFVSFSPNALDRSTWIPVVKQVVHPSLPPCPPPGGCDPTTTGVFQAGDPRYTDLGLVFLSWSPPWIKPAKIAAPNLLERPGTSAIPMTTVGYGNPIPNPANHVSSWDGLRKYRVSPLAQVLNQTWAAWQLPSAVCFGDSGAGTFFDRLPGGDDNTTFLVAVASDGGIDCLSKDLRVRLDSQAVRQWIEETIRLEAAGKNMKNGDR